MPLTIYSTYRGLASAVVSPAIIVALGAYGLYADGPGLWPSTILVVGLGLLCITLFDYPRRSVFNSEGILRVSFLRSHLVDWERVNAIERARTGFLARRRRPTLSGHETRVTPPTGAGLVARVGRRRYLLVNTLESRAEHQKLAALVQETAPHAFFGAGQPKLETVSSDLYRRRNRRAG